MSKKPEAWRAIDSLIWPHIAAKLVRRQHAEIERLHDELRQSSIDITLAEVERLKAENERLREALESIAANACCDRCQEAALVAKAALRREDRWNAPRTSAAFSARLHGRRSGCSASC